MFLHILLGFFIVLAVRYGKSFVVWFLDLQNKRKWMKNVPGPESRLIVGCLHKLPKDYNRILQFLLDEMNKVLDRDETVMRLWIGPKLIVIPLDAESSKVITSSNTELYKGTDYKFFQQWLGYGLLLGAGDAWFKIRKMATPAFHFAKIEEYTDAMDSHAKTMVQVIGEHLSQQEIDLMPYIKHCALDTLAEAAMGVQLHAQLDSNQPYVKAVSKFNSLALIYWQSPHYGMFGGFLWRLLGYKAQIDETLTVLKSMTNKVIKERVEVYNDYRLNGVEKMEKKRLNFLDLMLEYNSENQISVEQLRQEVDTFLFAGHDTTAHSVAWTMWCLASHPEIQEKVYEELTREFGHSDAEFKTNKLKELKYLDMVFKEGMRLFAPVPFVQRELQADQQIGGYLIPKGTSISISPFMLHRNPKVFPDPEKFNPENFAEGKEYSANAFIPFSAGPRNCIGQKFAVREAKIMIAHLVFNFKFTTHYNLHDNFPSAETVTIPSLGIPVKVSPRN